MVLFELLVQVLDKKLAGLLQSLPTFGRFNDEGFISSHGCIVLSKVQGLLLTIFQTQIHPSALLHNFPYATSSSLSQPALRLNSVKPPTWIWRSYDEIRARLSIVREALELPQTEPG